MTLRLRTLLLVTGLLVAAVGATAVALTWASTEALLAQTEADGVLIARLLARSADFADDITETVEGVIDGQMIVEASLAAQLVALGEAHGASAAEITESLREVTRHTVLDEIRVTDERGHAYVDTLPGANFTFRPDPGEQPFASAFWPLLSGERTRVVQQARPREPDGKLVKYAGVGGVDRPRIVQVGYNAQFLQRLKEQVGLGRLAQDLVDEGNVAALLVVDPNLVTLAYSAVPGREAGQDLTATDVAAIRRVVERGDSVSHLQAEILSVVVPIIDSTSGLPSGAAFVQLSADHIRAAERRQLELAGLIATTVLCLGVLASTILARRVTRPVGQLTAAAAAIETGTFAPATLDGVAARRDELGQLARVFQQMAREVYAREERLQQEVQALQIQIDQARKAQDVAEITQSPYFQQVREQARARRARLQGGPVLDPPPSAPG